MRHKKMQEIVRMVASFEDIDSSSAGICVTELQTFESQASWKAMRRSARTSY